jgi:O-antigen ligase
MNAPYRGRDASARSDRSRSSGRSRARPSLFARNADFKARRRLIATGGYFAVLAVFGGGLAGWTPGYILISAAIVVAVLALAWRDGFRALDDTPPLAKIALIGIAVLPLLQLIPLPPGVWQALPGQALRHQVLTLAGLGNSWQPLSVEPVGTAISALLTIGFVGLIAMLMRLSDRDFRSVLLLAFGLVLLGILIGMVQVVTDGQFPNPHGIAMGPTLQGFYANKNHMAVILAITILLVGFVVVPRFFVPQRRLLINLGYIAFVLVCIISTNSRAGLALGGVAALIVLHDQTRKIDWRYKIAGLVVLALLAGLILSTATFELVSGRFEDVDSDLRWRIATWSLPLAERYWALGSGAGSFATLFAANEQLAWVKPTFVNHAHNEYLQLVIEFGMTGVAVLAVLLASLVRPVLLWWRQPRTVRDHALMTFGFAAIVLFALHSAVDYPLRRPAGWAFLALALVAVFRGYRTGTGCGVLVEQVETT